MSSEGTTSFAEFTALMEAAMSLWVIDEEGNWTREGHPVRDLSLEDETLQQRLDRLEFKLIGWKRLSGGGDTAINVKMWNRPVNGWLEYLVETDMGGTEMEYLLAKSLPAYLKLREQLKRAGLPV